MGPGWQRTPKLPVITLSLFKSWLKVHYRAVFKYCFTCNVPRPIKIDFLPVWKQTLCPCRQMYISQHLKRPENQTFKKYVLIFPMWYQTMQMTVSTWSLLWDCCLYFRKIKVNRVVLAVLILINRHFNTMSELHASIRHCMTLCRFPFKNKTSTAFTFRGKRCSTALATLDSFETNISASLST